MYVDPERNLLPDVHLRTPPPPTIGLVVVHIADPYILPCVRIDRGAIRFVLAGAQIMCPGLTSKGGGLPLAEAALQAGTPVGIFSEGKEHAVAVGITKMGTEEMKKANKGVGVETTTYLGDDLWVLKSL